MAKPKTQQPPQIELRNVDDFAVESGYNVRDPKAFKANVKEIAALITAGGLDSSQPIQYVVKKDNDGTEHNYVRNHTRFDALKSLGIEQGYFVRVDRDETRDIVALVTENAGHPLNQYEQGAVYIRLRDGSADVENAPVGSEVREPMTMKEIAEVVGYSGQHIANCIAVYENTPEIAELVIEGKVSANAIVLAKKNVKADGTVLKILRAAIANAKEDGKETATEKHVKAVKDQFIPQKQQTGVTSSESGGKSASSKTSSDNGNKESDEDDKTETKQASSASDIGSTQQPEMELGGSTNSGKSGNEKQRRESLLVIVNQWAEKQDIPLTDEDIDALLSALIKSSIPF